MATFVEFALYLVRVKSQMAFIFHNFVGNHPEEPLQLEFYCLICESEICFYQRPLDIFPLRAEGNYPENLPEHIWVVILEGLDNFKRHLDENHFVAV